MTKSTRSKAQRKLPHSPITGKFESASPLNDPALLKYVTEAVEAIEMLTPVLLGLAHGAGSNTSAGRLMLQGLGALLLVRESVIDALVVDRKRANGDSAEVDVQRLVASVQSQWRNVLAGLPPPAGLPLVGIDKGAT